MAKFKHGNKAAEKWSKEYAEKVFNEMLDFTNERKDIFSIQEAYIEYGMPSSTYYYLLDRYPVLDSIKRGMNDIIIARVNSGALKNKLNNASAIWRMKQLGEKDQQYMDNRNTNKNINVELTGEEKKEAIEDIKRALNELNDY